MSLIKRGSNFSMRRRVPSRYKSVETRQYVWISLHTDSETVARQKMPGAWLNLTEAWEARLAGDTVDAEKRFEAAKELAAVRGYQYLEANKVAHLKRDELLERVENSRDSTGKVDTLEATATLGGANKPEITITKALEVFWTLAADRIIGKSDDQMRRWRNPRKKAIRNLVGVIGDKALSEITGDNMLDFRQWWLDQMELRSLTPNSANKDLIHLSNIFKTVNKMKRLGLDLPMSDLSFKEGEAQQRPPFSKNWIRTKLIADGALDGLNTEARCIVLGMINTGYRPSEGANLLPEQIKLEGDVPHISIEPVDRQLKSAYARRIIPLVGVSLEAFRECPNGFPRYRDNPGLSDTVNKFLRKNGLMETDQHSLYSLRHAFEDRMLAAGVDDRIRRDLFGHRLNRERYGTGATLKHLHKVVQSVAI